MSDLIPVSVIITIRNEEKRLPACLAALDGFQEIIVVDSHSQDRSVEVASRLGASVIPFVWNKQYPKKRQWCLENLSLKGNWVLFVDADEIVTPDLKQEIAALFQSPPSCAGYFIKGQYLSHGKLLRFGLQNNKLVLLEKTRIRFPEIDDLDIPGMGEMEGHYQPVPINRSDTLGQLKSPMLHDALDDERAWAFRHDKYARWEAGMNAKGAWPVDPIPRRERLKSWVRRSKLRAELMFFASYIVMGGFLDGKAGLKFANGKYRYYKKILHLKI